MVTENMLTMVMSHTNSKSYLSEQAGIIYYVNMCHLFVVLLSIVLGKINKKGVWVYNMWVFTPQFQFS